MNVEEIMTRDVKCCSADATLAQAARQMWDNDCGCMPVCDNDGRVVGMITDRDICMAALMKGSPLHSVHVDDAMARGVVSCQAQDPLAAVETRMQKHQLHRLPVIDDSGRLVGIVSLADIVRSASDGRGLRSLGTEDVVRTVAAICRPRSHSVDNYSSEASVR
jgi:CBS-domain-containing membrane protein